MSADPHYEKFFISTYLFADLVSLELLADCLNYIYSNFTSSINFIYIHFTDQSQLWIFHLILYTINPVPYLINLFLHNHTCFCLKIIQLSSPLKRKPHRIRLIIILLWYQIIAIWVSSKFLYSLEWFCKFFVYLIVGHVWWLLSYRKNLINCILFIWMFYFSYWLFDLSLLNLLLILLIIIFTLFLHSELSLLFLWIKFLLSLIIIYWTFQKSKDIFLIYLLKSSNSFISFFFSVYTTIFMFSVVNKKLKKVSNVEKNFIYECEICYEDYDTVKHIPMIVCSNYHALCVQCVRSSLFKKEYNVQKNPTGRYMCSKCS